MQDTSSHVPVSLLVYVCTTIQGHFYSGDIPRRPDSCMQL